MPGTFAAERRATVVVNVFAPTQENFCPPMRIYISTSTLETNGNCRSSLTTASLKVQVWSVFVGIAARPLRAECCIQAMFDLLSCSCLTTAQRSSWTLTREQIDQGGFARTCASTWLILKPGSLYP